MTPGLDTAVPRLLVLTDRRQAAAAGRSLPATVTEAVAAGAPAVLLREKDLPGDERRELAATLSEVVGSAGARLFVASDPVLARLGDGLHLAAADPVPGDLGTRLVGRSCHDRDEVVAAHAEGLDYVTVSPVAPTASKPGHGPPLGTDGFAALVAAADGVPVLALGGVTPANAADWCAGGAHGVAVMGAVMRAEDPGDVVARLLAQLPEELA